MKDYSRIVKTLSRHGEIAGEEELFDCPLCGDTKKHLYYNPDKDLWHCFRCGEGGHFKREQKLKKVVIASPVENPGWAYEGMPDSVTHKVADIPAGAVPLQYSTCPPVMAEFLRKKGVPIHIANNEWFYETKSTYYLIYIPIFFQKKYAGYQARRLDGITAHGAKYLTSPGMHKSEVLYNYDYVVEHAYKEVAIVEGVFDCFFIPNSVAILGKSISDFQARCFASTFKTALVALDLDAKDDVWKTSRKLYEMGVEVEVLRYHRIPGGSGLNSPGDFCHGGWEHLQVSTLLESYLFNEVSYEKGFVGKPFNKTNWGGLYART